jgi:hypothetical protein
LIVLRVLIDELSFIGVGWIVLLALLPLFPILLPRLADLLKAVSPYVERFQLGAVQVSFREARREPIALPSAGILASVPNDVAALSSGTAISDLVASLRRLRRVGGSPVVVIDLRDGDKWRLENLYFLARLLEIEPLVSELVFTEVRGGTDGYLVGTCGPEEFRRQVERTVPGYADAASRFSIPADADLSDAAQAQALGTMFMTLLNALPAPVASDADPARGHVTTKRVFDILARYLSTAAVEAVSDTLREDDLRTMLSSPHRFVPSTLNGRVIDLIDREAVALAVARAALAT